MRLFCLYEEALDDKLPRPGDKYICDFPPGFFKGNKSVQGECWITNVRYEKHSGAADGGPRWIVGIKAPTTSNYDGFKNAGKPIRDAGHLHCGDYAEVLRDFDIKQVASVKKGQKGIIGYWPTVSGLVTDQYRGYTVIFFDSNMHSHEVSPRVLRTIPDDEEASILRSRIIDAITQNSAFDGYGMFLDDFLKYCKKAPE
jgi:hypothetical protein